MLSKQLPLECLLFFDDYVFFVVCCSRSLAGAAVLVHIGTSPAIAAFSTSSTESQIVGTAQWDCMRI